MSDRDPTAALMDARQALRQVRDDLSLALLRTATLSAEYRANQMDRAVAKAVEIAEAALRE